jgi:hypothetical protein
MRPGNAGGFQLLKLSGPSAAPTVTQILVGANTAPAVPTTRPAIPGGSLDAHLFGTGVIAAVMEDRTSDGHTVIAFSGQQTAPPTPADTAPTATSTTLPPAR